ARSGGAAPNVAPADDNGDLDSEVAPALGDLGRDAIDNRGVDGLVDLAAGEGFARHLQNDPGPAGLGHSAAARLAADDDLSEPPDLRPAEQLLDGLLLVAGVGLFEEDLIL